MSADLSKDLSRISAAAGKLNATAETLTQQVVNLSNHLQQLQVGVSCYFTEKCFRTRADDPEAGQDTQGRQLTSSCCCYLGFDKADDGKWCVAVACRTGSESTSPPGPSDAEAPTGRTQWVRPFEACARNVRLALAPYVPDVIKGLACAVENVMGSAQASLGELEKVSKDLEAALAKKRG